MSLEFRDIHHAYGEREVLRGIDLAVAPGEIVCLLGASGCGKTTLLRLAAGLEPLQAGRIDLGGQVIAEPGRDTPPERRGVGVDFQDYALFPHLTVAENVAFGLRFAPRGERGWRVMDALARVGLESYQNAFPHMLSGGQQQRVALARALAPRPAVLLLDEAFASLDARLRERVRDDTLHVRQTSGIATLLVTHARPRSSPAACWGPRPRCTWRCRTGRGGCCTCMPGCPRGGGSRAGNGSASHWTPNGPSSFRPRLPR